MNSVSGVNNPDLIIKEYVDFNTDAKMFTCKLCFKAYARKFDLMSHIESVHFPNEFVYECEYCEAEFSNRNKRRRHMNVVHKGSTLSKSLKIR